MEAARHKELMSRVDRQFQVQWNVLRDWHNRELQEARLRAGQTHNSAATDNYGAGRLGLPAPLLLTPVILTEFIDSVVVAEVAVVAIFPNVAALRVEERVVAAAVRELDVPEVAVRPDGVGLKHRL